MPNQFGFETPEEVSARIRQRFATERTQLLNSAQSDTPLDQGIKLGALFREKVQRQRDTADARSKEAARLIREEGMSQKDAKAAAKAGVPVGLTAEERRAKHVETIQKRAFAQVEDLVDEGLPRAEANIKGMETFASDLTDMGRDDLAQVVYERVDTLRKEMAQEKRDIREQEAGIDDQELITEQRRDTSTEKDEILRLQEKRRSLIEMKRTAPGATALIDQDLADITERINTIKTRTGRTADDAAAELRPRTIESLESAIIQSHNQLSLLKSVGQLYDGEFLTYSGQAKNYLLAHFEKVGVSTEAGRDYITRYEKFQATAIANLNEYIHVMTGAQMSVFEAERLRKAIPDPENNSGTQFTARYIQVVKQIMATQARANYALLSGKLDVLPGSIGTGERDKDGNLTLAGGGSYGMSLEQFEPTDAEAYAFMGFPDPNAEPEIEEGASLSDSQFISGWVDGGEDQ